MVKKISFLFFLVLIGTAINAQVRVTGLIKSADDGEPIPFANIDGKREQQGGLFRCRW
ncbi:MAG: hypothetical protein WC960_03020 [Bacteroidales bacterium]